jgi:hypothetical protein
LKIGDNGFLREWSELVHLLLIDDFGELRSDRSEVVRTSFASTYISGRVSNYLVKNLGFAAINFFGSSCEVRLRPAIATDRCLASLMRFLLIRRIERIVLNHFTDDWNLELTGNIEAFERRVNELVRRERRTQINDFLAEPRPVDVVHSDTTFKGILDSWNEFGRNAGKATMSRLLKTVTDGRYAIIRHDPSEDSFRIAELGGGYLSFSPRFRTQCRGTDLAAQPDAEYGKFVADAYRRSLQQSEPIIEDVDAIIATHDMGRRRIRYRRLVLSRPGINGENWIVSSSILDPRIDLREKAVAQLSS